jgi:hypothetical protein
MRRSRIDLVRIQVVCQVLRQEHVLGEITEIKAAMGEQRSLFKGLFRKFYMREIP